MADEVLLSSVGAVVIGRNEGLRLIACLNSLRHLVPRLVYVDSGSTDGSVAAARALGAYAVELDISIPFTAARARNAGWQHLLKAHPEIQFVQFVDGDCEVMANWLPAATEFLHANPSYAIVCGRRRERHPEQSIYNRLCDLEWNTPVGDALACGGDALARADALQMSGGYRDDLIAGEEPEWCVRLREQGWKIRRLDHEMTLHDAAMHSFRQWWQRSKRAGFAFAAGAHLHGTAPYFHWVKETRRALVWGAGIPCLTALAAIFITPWCLLLFSVYPIQIFRLIWRGHPATQAVFLTLGKFAEAAGAIKHKTEHLQKKRSQIIEYK